MNMRFKQFINEGDSATFDLEKFKKDCAPFLSELKGQRGNLILYHGTGDSINNFEIRKFRERTDPKDMPNQVHRMLNDYFTATYGAPIRNWMFLTGSPHQAEDYGGLTAIFPIGDFQYLGSTDREFHDLTELHTRIWYREKQKKNVNGTEALSLKEILEKTGQLLINDIKSSKWYFNEQLTQQLLPCENEIMFKCDSFYIISVNGQDHRRAVWDDQILPYLESL
jgi:hypothetical protein